MDWIYLAQDRNQWMVLMNTAMNLWISENVGDILEWLSYLPLLRDSAPYWFI
jgi:hypothetical protein